MTNVCMSELDLPERDLSLANEIALTLDIWQLEEKNSKNCCEACFKFDILDSCKRKPISNRQIPLFANYPIPTSLKLPLCAYANVRKKHANFHGKE